MMAVITVACSGNIDDSGEIEELTLYADVEEIIADGTTAVNFTVMYGDEDVTSEASVKCVSGNADVAGTSFTSEAIGAYVFRAFYDDVVSQNDVTVVAKTRFQRRVCVMEFTGTWCPQCPQGATTLNFLTTRSYKDKAYVLAFHNDDAYEIPASRELDAKFGLQKSYPAFVTDMRDAGLVNDGGCGDTIEESLYESVTHCAVSVSCSYNQASGNVDVEAELFSETDAVYSLAAYVIEDKVVGEQAQPDNSVDNEYTHRHVVRAMLSSSVMGDELGTVAAGCEKTAGWSFKKEDGWNVSNLSVAVLAIDEDGQVNNMAVCMAGGGRMEYGYIK